MARTLTAVRPASREAVHSRSIAIGLVAVALLAVAAYASTPFNFWVGDDYNYLGPKGIDRIISFFESNVALRAFYRPLNWTSWALDYALWGTVPFGWHVSSIMF